MSEYHTVCDDLIRNVGVDHIIGCYTSASRKQVLPIVERTDRLLWYPARYEGFECSDNVIYVGASPNHNVLPLVRYVLDNLSREIFCVGSNYVWTWETNRVTRELVTAAQMATSSPNGCSNSVKARSGTSSTRSSGGSRRSCSTRWSAVRATISSAPFTPPPKLQVSTFPC